MNLSILAVKRPITTCMVFVAVLVMGMVAYQQLPVQLIPDMTFPGIGVSVRSSGSPEDIQEKITKPIEGIAAEMPRVKTIHSFTRSDRVWMRVEFEYGTDIQYALVDLEERLASFRNSLDDRRTSINAFPFSTTDFQRAFMFLSVRAPGDEQTLFKVASTTVEEDLNSISGVSNVELYGLRSNSAEIQINTDLLAAYRLDIGQVISRVQAAVSEDTFLGRVRAPRETYYVRLDDKIKTVEELGGLFVDNKGIVRLKDVADVYLGSSVDRWVNRTDGKNSVSVRLERDASENLIALAHRTRTRIEELNKKLPPGVEVVIQEDFAKYVEEAIDKVKQLALIGAGLALLVPLVFFRSIRVAMIVFLSVPISLISVFNLFYAANMSINIFSIVGLALGVGMLVDNSIVVVENSFRLYGQGKSPRDSAMMGGADVGRGLLAATLTTIVVFVPIAFLDGEFKMIIKEPTLALIFPLIMSLLVALTLVPVFTWLVLKSKKRKSIRRGTEFFYVRWYRRILKSALRYRGRVLLIIALLLAITVLDSCERLRSATTSNQANREYMEFYFESFQGADLSSTDRSVRAIEERLAKHADIKTFSVAFNSDGGEARITLKKREERQDRASWEEIYGTILDFVGPIPGLELSLFRQDDDVNEAPASLGPRGMMALKGLDNQTVKAYSDRLIDALRTHPLVTNAELDERRGNPLYVARIDREKTRLFDVRAQAIGRYVGATRSSGTISSVQLENGEDRTDVLFTIDETEGTTIDKVKEMALYSPKGGNVPLGELTRFQTGTEPRRLYRRDRQSAEDLIYNFIPGSDRSQLTNDIKKIIAGVPNPGGVTVEFSGDERRLEERDTQFFFIVGWGSILVWVVMAAVFESFWVPFTILATNPLMLIGIVWGLVLAGLPMDDLAAFGIILLVGLAVNNGIVMMDRTLNLQRQGQSRHRAVFEAAATRLRPIIMTYLTTVLGLAPLALVGSEDDQWRPVAVVVIGGLTSATVLTLVVLPCFYMIGDDFVRWARTPFINFLGALFQIPEGLANLFFHPIKTCRRQIPFMPAFRRLVWAMLTFTVESLRLPLKVIVYTPADAWYLVRQPRRTRHPELSYEPGRIARLFGTVGRFLRRTMLAVLRWLLWLILLPWRGLKWTWRKVRRRPVEVLVEIQEADLVPPPAEATVAEPAAVSLTNIHVYFPAPGWRGLRGKFSIKYREAGRVAALDGITLAMEAGLFGLLGPNGAGKTTVLRVIAGLQEPTRGTVRLFGTAHRDAPGQLAPLIGYLPQTHGRDEGMTLFQFLEFYATMTAQTLRQARALTEFHPALRSRLEALAELDSPAQRRRAIYRSMEEVNLAEVAHNRIGTFSGGMKQRAGIARILLQAPPILIVDEPTAGLDPVERVRVRLLLSRLAQDRLVLFSTHIVEDLEQHCDALAIMGSGRILYSGVPQKLLGELNGRLWDVLAKPDENPMRLRENLIQRGAKVLFQIVEQGQAGFRVVAAERPGEACHPVPPTLQDALLGVLPSASHEISSNP